MLGFLNLIKRRIYEVYYTNHIAMFDKDCRATIQIIGRPYIRIEWGGQIRIGKNFICRSGAGQAIDNSTCSKIIVRENANLTIGDYTGISNTTIECKSSIKIGSSVNIGAGCMIFDTDFHSTDWRDRHERMSDVVNQKVKPVTIGDCVFIGARCIICKGVTICDRSMVAAGSVVVKNIPSDELWGGNPAKFIRKLV